MLAHKFSVVQGYGKSFGTFGELLQGVLSPNRNFLVTLPIDLYAHAYFSLEEGCNELAIHPAHKQKAKRMASHMLNYFKLPVAGNIILESKIPEGKGMASSSADLVAIARALSSAYNLRLSNTLLESFMAEIEPSDGVMYDGVVSYYQSEAILRSYLGKLPPMKIISADEGGEVNTIEFHEKRKALTRLEKAEYAQLLQELEKAIRKKRIDIIGCIATRSAVLNQRLKKNLWLEPVLEITQKIRGLGVVIAHSGTCLGILLDANDNPRLPAQLQEGAGLLESYCGGVQVYDSYHFT